MYFEAASALINKLRHKLNGSTDREIQAVRLLASMMLSLQHLIKQSSKTEAKDATSKLSNCSHFLLNLMQGWIGNFNVIGRPLFGGKCGKREQEIKVM